MVRAAWIVVAGCGRIDFASQSAPPIDAIAAVDAVTGHDEDGDGIPDVIDPCPHIAGDTADADGDGVGDACDPNPSTPTESWIAFYTMQPGDQPFDDISAFTQKADSLHLAGSVSPLRITRSLGSIRFDLGYDINALFGTGQHQVAAGIDNAATAEYYFGEINQQMAGNDVAIVSYDITNGYKLLGSMTFPGMHPGSGSFRLDASAMNGHKLVTGWVGEPYTATAPTPAFSGGGDIRIALNGLDMDVRYVALIATQ